LVAETQRTCRRRSPRVDDVVYISRLKAGHADEFLERILCQRREVSRVGGSTVRLEQVLGRLCFGTLILDEDRLVLSMVLVLNGAQRNLGIVFAPAPPYSGYSGR
jgi:uncharacterized protein YceH (UPF0502 family)